MLFQIFTIGEATFRINLATGATWKLWGYGLQTPTWSRVVEEV